MATSKEQRRGGRDVGDSVLKLRLERQRLVVLDYFTPFNQKVLDAKDWDLGSQGPVLLPAQSGMHPRLLVVAGKEGKLYLLDRDKLGKFQEGSDSQIVQSVNGIKDAYGTARIGTGTSSLRIEAIRRVTL